MGIGAIYPVGFAGNDGEGFELSSALERVRGVELKHFVRTGERRTFTYCKPLMVSPGKPPLELNRLDSKNWTPTPEAVEKELIRNLAAASEAVRAIGVLDQVDVPETGVVTSRVLNKVQALLQAEPLKPILADSRRGLRDYPPVIFKMNATELTALTGAAGQPSLPEVKNAAVALARRNRRMVFISLAAQGILGASPDGQVCHVPALPIRGEIDIVGAGDAVSANLICALAAGATLSEALELANAAASVVIHKLGTTGTASVAEIAELLLGVGG